MSTSPYLPPTYQSNCSTISVSPTFPKPGDTVTMNCKVTCSGIVGFSCSYGNSCTVNGTTITNQSPGPRMSWGALPGNNPVIEGEEPYAYQESQAQPNTYVVQFVLSNLAFGIFDPNNNPLDGCWVSVFSGNPAQGWIASAPFNVQPTCPTSKDQSIGGS